MKKKISAAACAALLLAAVLATALPAGAAEKVYFMGVNDIVLSLDAETMPRVVNGVLYVPYIMFDPSTTTGASLGVFSTYSRAKGNVMIYNRSQALIFDLNAGNSTFQGKTYQDRAIIRNSTVFVPVDTVCQIFDLEWSRLTVEYGYIVRVKSSAAIVADADYTDAAYFTVRSQYQSYIQSKNPTAEPPASSGEPAPSQSVEDPGADGARVYLGFRMESGDGLTGILDHLKRYGAYGVFFCRPEELLRRDDEIRTLVAAGHRVGLLLDAATMDGQLEQAAEGQALLAHVARTETAVYFSENLSDADLIALSDVLCLWETTLDATPDGRSAGRQAEAVISAVRRNRRYFALLDDSPQSAQALGRILSNLTGDGCEFRLANEVVLRGD